MDKILKFIKPEDVFKLDDDNETFPMAFLAAVGVLEFKIDLLNNQLKGGYSFKDENEKAYKELKYLLYLTQYLYFIFEEDQYKKNQYEKKEDLFLIGNCENDLTRCKNTLIKYYKEYSGLQKITENHQEDN
jgi:hypothetical protein